eukprot:CAMPEP_0184545310 /NCGR_PEP_ID=MMETSP0199_2-20130426/4223_1 /TAXON_ID=1112570 /ORGANISM="Thraustochytrium sp., Strain LLF1b" /LENGTH=509 /DNA_ID=CAMNT_0026939603 /DNA_START=62 /DNA_END=1591 /DNA_ORIENTATION=-
MTHRYAGKWAVVLVYIAALGGARGGFLREQVVVANVLEGDGERQATLFAALCSPKPSQLHLALVDGPDKMVLSWTNKCTRSDALSKQGFSLDSGLRGPVQLEQWVEGKEFAAKQAFSVTYWLESNKAVAHVAFANTSRYFLSFHHAALMTGLLPGEKYCYRITESLEKGSCFDTEPHETSEFSFISIGDMGTNNSWGTIRGMEKRRDASFILHDGDISYADDLAAPPGFPRPGEIKRGPYGYEEIYDQYMDSIEHVTQRTPYMTAVGNHDVSCSTLTDLGCDHGQRNFGAYRSRFRMPWRESGATSQGMWYSFNYRSIHIACIDTETDYPNAPTQWWTPFFDGGRGGGFGDQLAWLEQDLETAQRNPDIKWILVVGHRPIVASSDVSFPPWAGIALRRAFEPLLHKYGVDVYIGAHIHNYERSHPAKYKKRCPVSDRCPVFLVNGAAGNCEGAQGRGISRTRDLVAAGAYMTFGYGVFHVTPEVLKFQFIASETQTSVEHVVDEFTLKK